MRQALAHSGLRKAQIEMLQDGFNQLKPPPITPPQSLLKPPSAHSRGRPPTQTSQAQARCQFCGRGDPTFANSETMDLHFWKDCPMLTECAYCNQVIEIETLNQHLLRECDKRAEFRECPRCGESIYSTVYEDHVEAKLCNIQKPAKAAMRCPLCHLDVAPGEAGWRRHILEEGCLANARGK